MAFRSGSRRSIRSMCRSSSSTGPISPERSAAAIAPAVASTIGSIDPSSRVRPPRINRARRAPPRSCPRCRRHSRRRRGPRCADRAPAPPRPRPRPPPPRPPSRARRGAASPPRGSSRAGWRRPLPAMSGAEPWTGSNRPGPSAPRLAEGSIPSEPVSIAASSERMSPNMFSVRITSKRDGSETSCIAALSTSMWSSSTSGYSAATRLDRLAPQARGLEHVRLVDGGHPAAAARPRPRSRPGRCARSPATV